MATDQNPVIESVQSVYALALLELANEAGSIDAVAAEIQQLGEVLEQSPDLVALLESRVLSVQDRAGIIDRIFKPRVSDLLFRFLQVLNLKNRLNILPGMIVAYRQANQTHFGQIEVEAFVAQALDAEQESQVAARLSKAIGRTVILRQRVDPDLLGGLKLRIGDEIVDGSVVAQLRILREKMIVSGRKKAAEIAAAMPNVAAV
ncbi:MAG: ATP synthase F1 subunit delta [Planctomycetota bacterium]|nr:ATP synthase F1 subunit delta [Planctomycetota bacterium]